MPFSTANPTLQTALAAHGYTTPTAVQSAVLDPAYAGRDLLVSARTGSGKTVGFGLAMADAILDGERAHTVQSPLALVVAPTRELAMQVQRELTWLYAPAGGKVAACVGGMEYRAQLRALSGGAQIVVGTPGRLCDLVDKGALDLSKLKVLVLDEADEMLDMGFRDELEKLLQTAPVERRTLLFSATLPDATLGLARRYQKEAVRVNVATTEAHADIAYKVHVVAQGDREAALVNVLRHLDAPSAIVFLATREGVHHLHSRLSERGFPAAALSGDFTQAERSRALQALRDGRAKVLVATDVAARGLDVPALDLVVHFDLPMDHATLLHRSGRTGRAGRKGTAVMLVPPSKRRLAQRLVAGAKVKAVWSDPPSLADVMAADQGRLVRDLAPTGDLSEEDRSVARQLLAEHDPEALVASLVKARRESNPAAEDVVAAPRAPEPAPRPGAGPPGPSGPDHGVWFRVNVGREHGADPRRLLPLICRRGNITSADVGPIRIYGSESRFLVADPVADAFETEVRRPDRREPNVRFLRA